MDDRTLATLVAAIIFASQKWPNSQNMKINAEAAWKLLKAVQDAEKEGRKS